MKMLRGRDRMRLAFGAAAGVVRAGIIFISGGHYLGGRMGYTQCCLDVGLTRGGGGGGMVAIWGPLVIRCLRVHT